MNKDLAKEISSVKIKPLKTSCCKSYRLPKGRCYNCSEEGYKRKEE